ncbi:hypothetical protein CF68_06900 [Cupriavidus sp. SK-4]|nr:hypothetical protein CF68_06900 [Cupriavidus sp. SK-4]
MRSLWLTDPWTPGFTCHLEPEARQHLVSWLDGHGLHYDWLAPMTQDWLAWKFVNLVRRKCLHEPEGDAVIAELRKRDARIPDPPADGSALDMTADSDACAWRPSLILHGEWVEPQPGRRKVVKRVGTAHAPGTKQTRQAGKSGVWAPSIGPATLSSLEQREIAHARERDLLAALMDGAPVGTKEVERAQARIEAARRAVLHA